MSSTRPRPGRRYDALLGLLRAAETIWNASRAFFAPWGLSPSQFNVLNLLRDQPDGLSQSELSRALVMHRSNVTGLVDRLEAHGWAARREDATDRRAWRVVLTPAGERLLAEILPSYYDVVEEVWGDVPAARARQLGTTLQQLEQRALILAARHGARES